MILLVILMVQTNAFQKIFIQLLDSNQFLRLSYKENNEVHETSKSSFLLNCLNCFCCFFFWQKMPTIRWLTVNQTETFDWMLPCQNENEKNELSLQNGQKVFDVFKRSNWGNPAPAEWTGIIPFWCEICLPLIHPYCQFWKIFYIEKFPSFSHVDTSLGKTSKTGMFMHIIQRLATNLNIFIQKVLKCHQVR